MAIFEFGETTYVDRLWYVSWTDTDWMAALYRDGPDATWRATYRFRYYAKADDAWDGEDEKHIYELTTKDGSDTKRDEMRAIFERIAGELATGTGGDVTVLVVEGDSERACKLFAAQPWAHVRVSPAPPARPQ